MEFKGLRRMDIRVNVSLWVHGGGGGGLFTMVMVVVGGFWVLFGYWSQWVCYDGGFWCGGAFVVGGGVVVRERQRQ